VIGCIGVVSPGAMGAEVGRSLAILGPRVVVALENRSERSQARAAGAGLEDVGRLDALVRASDLILSIVPPASALDVATALAREMTASGANPVVIDANAISPARATEIAAVITQGGGHYIDGGIIGGPPKPHGRTDLFVSGVGARTIAPDLTSAQLVTTCVGEDPTAASALKMCFAAWTKGTSALLIAIRALARRQGVDDALVELWGRTQPALLAQSDTAGTVAARAWRWVDEMSEISRTFEEAGLPGGAADAASRLYERLEGFKDVDPPPSIDDLIAAVLS
jgi:3-hydroxyisobutyrate dehydrogenase-like beta-hydroxyacid dehydrogenase